MKTQVTTSMYSYLEKIINLYVSTTIYFYFIVFENIFVSTLFDNTLYHI